MTELAGDGAGEIVVIVILCVSGVIGDEEDFFFMGVLYMSDGPSDGESGRRLPLISFGSLRDLADARLSISIVLDAVDGRDCCCLGGGDFSLVSSSFFSCCCDNVGGAGSSSCDCSASLCFFGSSE